MTTNNGRDMAVQLGRKQALELRARAPEMDGTELIAEEDFIPDWKPMSFLNIAPGTPFRRPDQVWKLIQPYDGTVFTDPPETMRAQWGPVHTKDPAKAKPYVAPLGTSGLYYKDECCTDNGRTWRCIVAQTDHRPTAWPQGWEEVAT